MQSIQVICPTDPVGIIFVTLCVVVGGSVIGASIGFGLMAICQGIYKTLTKS